MLWLWYTGILSTLKAGLINVCISLCYLGIQLVRYHVFEKIVAKTETFPALTYYYKEYQCDCRTARTRLVDELSAAERLTLERSGGWLNLYFENPFDLEDVTKGRCTIGWATNVDVPPPEYSLVLEKHGLRQVHLTPCEIASVEMKIVDELTYIIAAIKTMNPLWNYVEEKYQEVTLKMEGAPMVEWIFGGSIMYGALVGEARDQFNLSAYPPAALTKQALLKRAQHRDKYKKTT